MAKSGKSGAVYFRPNMTEITISFADTNPDSISDSGNGFVIAGFVAGADITVSGSVSNDGTYTIATVAPGILILVGGDVLATEAAGATVTIRQDAPGRQLLGFTNWSSDEAVDVLDVTAFDSPSDFAEVIPGKGNFTITADSWFAQSSRILTVSTIAFVDSNPDTITDSGNAFVSTGFFPGNIIISGATNAGNNGNFAVDTVTAGTLTLATGETLTVEGAGATVTIIQPIRLTPGQTYLIRLFTDFSNTKFVEGLAVLGGRANDIPHDGLVGENLTLTGTGVLTTTIT